ncbi:MAG: DUF5071 domain-containing protein [Calditrichota bacterium]
MPDDPNRKYELYYSESSSSYSFFSMDERIRSLEDDAELVWTVKNSLYEIACLKRNEFLEWEPYKPHIKNDEDLKRLLPIGKFELDKAQLMINLGYPAVAPVLEELFEWLQDMNWPVAQKIAPFLVSIGEPLIPHLRKIFADNDAEWKFFSLGWIVQKLELPVIQQLEGDLRRMAEAGTEAEHVQEAASEILEKLTAHHR